LIAAKPGGSEETVRHLVTRTGSLLQLMSTYQAAKT